MSKFIGKQAEKGKIANVSTTEISSRSSSSFFILSFDSKVEVGLSPFLSFLAGWLAGIKTELRVKKTLTLFSSLSPSPFYSSLCIDLDIRTRPTRHFCNTLSLYCIIGNDLNKRILFSRISCKVPVTPPGPNHTHSAILPRLRLRRLPKTTASSNKARGKTA
jgi:hypothetical protein